jgi:hypothetical protein
MLVTSQGEDDYPIFMTMLRRALELEKLHDERLGVIIANTVAKLIYG